MPKFHHLAGAPVSARLSAHVEPWFQAATSVQMENLRSYGCVVSGVWCVVRCVVWCGVLWQVVSGVVWCGVVGVVGVKSRSV